MKSSLALRLLVVTHTALLRLFPPDFRTMFQVEMQTVFFQAARAAADEGAFALGKFLLRELMDLPLSALTERVVLWRASVGNTRNGHEEVTDEQITPKEMLVAIAVFLIPAGFILLKSAPPSLVGLVIPPSMLIFLLVGSMVGSAKRFPRWSLPYVGLLLSAVVFMFLFQWKAERIAMSLAARFVIEPSNELGRVLLVASWEGVIWFSLLFLVACTIMLLATLPRFRPLIRRLQEDWTQISYLLYGGATLALVLAFDEYPQQEPYTLLGLLCLAVGAWFYLRSQQRNRGFLALLMGVTISMAVAAVGKWTLVKQQTWSAGFRLHPLPSERWLETEQVLIVWAWVVFVMTLPGLIKRLRHELPADV